MVMPLPLVIFKGIIRSNDPAKEESMRTKEGRKVIIQVKQPKTEAERIQGAERYKRVLEILAEGMFEYILKNEYFRDDKKEEKETTFQ